MPPNNPPPPPPFSAPPNTPPPLGQPRLMVTPPPKKKRGWMILALILAVLLVLSLFSNLAHWVGGVMDAGDSRSRVAGPKLDEVLVEDNDSRNKIAIVDVEGIITSQFDSGYSMVDLIKEQLKRADDDERVKAVILKVNSPGGEVLASDDIYRLIADFQENTHKPVVASMGSVAASGGYYISSPCRWIVANELTITGSIGVIMHGFNYRGLMDKIGLRPEVYKSGKFKDMMSPDREPSEITDEERQMMQGLIDDTYKKFKSVVIAGRTEAHKENKTDGHALAADWESYADGRVLSGKQALDLGLVDELGDFDAAVARAEKLVGLDKYGANLVEYSPRHDLTDFLRLFGKTSVPAVKIDLGMDLPKLQAGQLYFLSSAFVH